MQGAGHKESLKADRSGFSWLSGLSLVTACSWARWALTGSLKVDENYPSQLAGTVLFAALLVGWTLMVLGWRGFLVNPPARPRALVFAGLAVAGLMLPMLSNDVFSLMTYGSLAGRGQDVYTSAAALPDSPFFAFVGEHWNEKVCVYGPTTLLAIAPVALAGHSPWLALLILRVTWMLPLAAVVELSLRRLADRPFFHAMVWLNPLFVVQGPGQLHADVLGLAAVVAGMVVTLGGPGQLPVGRRRAGGWLAYAVAVLGKYTFAFAGLWFWLFDARTWQARVARLPLLAIMLLLTGALAFAPFWRGPATLIEPLRALGGMNPGGSITEVAGILIDLARGAGVPHADAPVAQALDAQRAAHAATWATVSLVQRLVALGVGARILWVLLRRPHRDDRVALGTGALIVALLTLASPRFQSWYLLAALPFFGLACTPAWRRWWLAVVALAVGTELVQVLARSSPILPVVSVVTNGGAVGVFLLSFRERYWRLDASTAPPAATVPAAP